MIVALLPSSSFYITSDSLVTFWIHPLIVYLFYAFWSSWVKLEKVMLPVKMLGWIGVIVLIPVIGIRLFGWSARNDADSFNTRNRSQWLGYCAAYLNCLSQKNNVNMDKKNEICAVKIINTSNTLFIINFPTCVLLMLFLRCWCIGTMLDLKPVIYINICTDGFGNLC